MKRPSAAAVYLSKWPESSDTFKTMRASLNSLAHVLGGETKNGKPRETALTYPWHELRFDDVLAIPAKLTNSGLLAPTVNKALSALRGVLKVAWRSGAIPDQEYRVIEIKNLIGETLASGRALSKAEVNVIERSLSKVSSRDAAIIAVLCAYGLRRVELVRLRKENFDPSTGRILAHGKRNKERSIPIPDRWRDVVATWWSTLKPRAFAFVDDDGAPITRRQVSYIIERFYKLAGVDKFTPHDLRRTFVTRICEIADIAIAQRLAGHVSSDVTARYDRRGEDAEDKAVKGL